MIDYSGLPPECAWVDQALSDYLNDDLPDESAERVRAHLESCRDCQGRLELLQQTVRLLQRLPSSPVPRSFTLPLATRRSSPSAVRWTGRLRYATGALAAAFLLSLGTGLLLSPTTPERATIVRNVASTAAPAAAAPASSFAPAHSASVQSSAAVPVPTTAAAAPAPFPQETRVATRAQASPAAHPLLDTAPLRPVPAPPLRSPVPSPAAKLAPVRVSPAVARPEPAADQISLQREWLRLLQIALGLGAGAAGAVLTVLSLRK